MKRILLFGAGKSATVLIDYLISHAAAENWELTIADADINLVLSKTGNSSYARPLYIDIRNDEERKDAVRQADIVISLLPPALHTLVAKTCIEEGRNLLAASYIDEEVNAVKDLIRSRGLFFLFEMGLDPGIDHMSALRIMDEIKAKGGIIRSFKSHCGGLVAPACDTNPWHYKISWNPRNIVMAGKAGARFLENGNTVTIPYEELFTPGRTLSLPGEHTGPLCWYPNRDSLNYLKQYDLPDIKTFVRTTLRHPEFMTGWKKIIDLHLTDESLFYDTDNMSLMDFFKAHLERTGLGGPEQALTHNQLLYLGFGDNETLINKGRCNAPDVLQFAVERKLALQPKDRDMIVMVHEIGYELSGKQEEIKSWLVLEGEDRLRTAMAKTVGLPLGIAARLILNGTLHLSGLYIPSLPEIYRPVLEELAEHGIRFKETIT